MTDKLREAAQQALEALDNMTDSQSNPARRNFPTIHDYGKSRRAADALRAALAQQDAQAALQGWRSMDTAPLGVTAFFWIKWSDVPVIGEWDGKSLSANHEHLDVSCGAYCYGGSVCTAGHTEPTHWMPLPPAPDAAPHAAPTPPAQQPDEIHQLQAMLHTSDTLRAKLVQERDELLAALERERESRKTAQPQLYDEYERRSRTGLQHNTEKSLLIRRIEELTAAATAAEAALIYLGATVHADSLHAVIAKVRGAQ